MCPEMRMNGTIEYEMPAVRKGWSYGAKDFFRKDQFPQGGVVVGPSPGDRCGIYRRASAVVMKCLNIL